jgi:cytoskeletal protein CcmA (bactofilin family)
MPTLELRSSTPLLLKDIALCGNIVITAPQVQIGKDARLQDILIFAQDIRVESGFEGRIQMFATDSIVVEQSCSLLYPSTAVLASSDELGAILIGADSQLEGLVLADATLMDPRAKNQSYTQIAPKAEVIGTVIVPENLDLQGTVTGTVRTGKFRLITGGGVYENYLLDATIQHEGLSSQYAMPLLQSGHPQFMEILHLFSK